MRLPFRKQYRNHPFTGLRVRGDYRGIPTAECVCGSRSFFTVMWVDDEYIVAGYETTGLCCVCHHLVTVATAIDHIEYEELG